MDSNLNAYDAHRLASENATLREQLATARADGEWLAHWAHVHSNLIPKAADAHRIGDIARRMAGGQP